MFQADATIAWIDRNGMAQAQDYYLSNYVQVRSEYSTSKIFDINLSYTLSVVVVEGRVPTH